MSQTNLKKTKKELSDEQWDKVADLFGSFSENLDEFQDMVSEVIQEYLTNGDLQFKHMKEILKVVATEISEFED